MAVQYVNGAWWVNGVAYRTEADAKAADAGGPVASSDFNQDTFDAIPTVRAPMDEPGALDRSHALRAQIDQLAATPYGTPQSAGGTATQWQSTAKAPDAYGRQGTVTSRPVDAQGNPLSLNVRETTTGPNAGPSSYQAFATTPAGGNLPVNVANTARGVIDPTAPLVGNNRAVATRGGATVPNPVPSAASAAAPTADQTASNDARQQQDMLIAQLVQQAGRAQSAPAVDSAGYNQTRDQSNATYNALGALSGNNISAMQIGSNAANSGQRDDSRGQLLGTANSLTGNAGNNIAFQDADATQRNTSGATLANLIQQLQDQSRSNVGDVQVNAGQYNQGRDVTSDIIQRLIAEAQRPEGASAAEKLMLLGQERAVRNAAGDAASTAGGWRSQLVNERRAEGQAAQMSSDQAAQSAALRANEETQYRTDVRNALAAAGGLQSDVSGRDLALGTTNAGLTAQILQGNQNNARESLGLAGTNATAQLNSDTGFATSNADRRADVEKANQLNTLNSLLGAGNLQSNALTSDTGFATSDADRAAANARANQSSALTASTANQANSLAAQIAASNSAQQRLESDRALATANADRLERVNAANATNAIQALQAAGVISTGTRQGDIQLSQGDQRAVVDMAIAAAGVDAQKYSAQLQYAIGMANVEQRKAELQRLYDTDPTMVEKFLGALGPVASTLGLLGWKPLGK